MGVPGRCVQAESRLIYTEHIRKISSKKLSRKTYQLLLYAINGGLIYVIPYYGTSSSLTVPVMVAVVNAYTKQVGSYAITNPNDPTEVQSATSRAVSSLGVSTGTQQTISGNVTKIDSYVVSGNTRWIIGIKTNSTSTIQVLAKAETLTSTDQVKIATLTNGTKIT